MQNKGFTLIEMILVLIMMSIFLLLVPKIQHNSLFLNFETEKIRDILLNERKLAKLNKEKREIKIYDSYLTYDGKQYAFINGMTCNEMDIIYNEKGDINMANTLTCKYYNHKRQIVLHLGNGDVEIK